MRNDRILEIAGLPPNKNLPIRIVPGFEKPTIGIDCYSLPSVRIIHVGFRWLEKNYTAR